MEEFEEVFVTWEKNDNKLKDVCLTYIKNAINNAPNKEIVFPNDNESFDNVYVICDGHYEYETGLSIVLSLSFHDGDYYVNTENGDFIIDCYVMYNADLYDIAKGVKSLKQLTK